MLHFFSQCSISPSLSAQLLLLGLNFFTLLFLSVLYFFFYCLPFFLSAQFLLSVLNLFSQCPAFSSRSTSSLSAQLLLSVLKFSSHCSSASLVTPGCPPHCHCQLETLCFHFSVCFHFFCAPPPLAHSHLLSPAPDHPSPHCLPVPLAAKLHLITATAVEQKAHLMKTAIAHTYPLPCPTPFVATLHTAP